VKVIAKRSFSPRGQRLSREFRLPMLEAQRPPGPGLRSGRTARVVMVLAGCIAAVGLWGAAGRTRLHAQGAIEVLHAQGNVFVLATPGGNTLVQVGDQGPLVVDTQTAALSAQVLEAIRTLSPRPIRHIVLTSGGDQQAGGVANLSKAGRYVRVIDSIDPRGLDARASIIAHVNVLNQMVSAGLGSDAWPTDTYFTPAWSLFSNGEAVQLVHVPSAYSDGDTIVFFRRSDVVSAGALFDARGYPRFDPERGGINGVIEGLNRMLEITVAGENQEGGTIVVPGRGRMSDQTDLANYRDMATIIRDRVRDQLARGHSLEQVQLTRPTADYDALYEEPSWTGARFVEAIYRNLSGAGR
jgi:cyclase